MDGAQILAVILDLDGTLLDSERATEGVLKEFLALYGKVLDTEKEEKRLGKMHRESAASIVVDYDLPMTAEEFSEKIMPLYQERWPEAKALPGANRLIRHLHKHAIPLGLASNSIKKHIERKISYQQGWRESFSVILGGDEVDHGKPSPDIFLESAKRMGVDASHCLVIEDSLVGVTAAKAAGMKVVVVPSLHAQADHYAEASCVLHSLLEFQPDLWGLPSFQDWIENVLPIEPLYVRGLLGEGAPHEASILMDKCAENDSFATLPNQVAGVFFGWAKLGTQGIFKKACIVSEMLNHTFGEQLLLLVVGYIRKLNEENTEEGAVTNLGATEKDKGIADTALDQPMFADHKSDPFLAE